MKVVPATDANIELAAGFLDRGELVVMPTETVYGLAADAGNPDAIKRVFLAKGRPADNPLIVHIADLSWLEPLVAEVPAYAMSLAEKFWPGPLTLVLKKQSHVNDLLTAGLDTVAVRWPAHPVARKLLERFNRPLGAPSANRFTHLSPTRAEHVDPEIAKQAAMVLDGGPCDVGLESTVLDCTGDAPRILRPGRISKAEIEGLLGMTVLIGPGPTRNSPGMYPRHYAPKTPVRLVDRLQPEQAGLVLSELTNPAQVLMPSDPVAYGALLYETLHDLDQVGLEAIYIEMPPDEDGWVAVLDRLRKAAS